jgi:UDPglucose--hexose-1-phosphate uridylyltransferase
MSEHAHRRLNALTGEWVLVSPHRSKRPWQGQLENHESIDLASYDENCFLCPGNKRITGERNTQYSDTFVFKNDFAALNTDTPNAGSDDPLFSFKAEKGESRVICFSPDHSKTLAQMTSKEIEPVIQCWIKECQDLSPDYQWIQLFENKGAMMGCSNPHPHGQVWAQSSIPTLAEKKSHQLAKYFEQYKAPLLSDYAERESQSKERIVCENEYWLVVVPYWAAWPFETLLLPKFDIQRMTDLKEKQAQALAEILQNITAKYDNLFNCSFPYSMGWHGAPFDNEAHREWTLHAHFFPPLLRSATVRKFMVGYELMAEAQRDLTPEQAAERLRAASTKHYSQKEAQ